MKVFKKKGLTDRIELDYLFKKINVDLAYKILSVAEFPPIENSEDIKCLDISKRTRVIESLTHQQGAQIIYILKERSISNGSSM